jgi:hypothetical protein
MCNSPYLKCSQNVLKRFANKIRKRFYTKKRELLLVLGQQPNSPSLSPLWHSPTGPNPTPSVHLLPPFRKQLGGSAPVVPGAKMLAADRSRL